MQPESSKLLRDILDAVGNIVAYTRDKTEDVYRVDSQLRHAVQWNFTVIGEALAQLHKIDPSTAEQVTEWRRIIAFGNQLVHGYGVIQDAITWDIVQNKVPVLQADVQSLLGSASFPRGL